MKPLRKVLFWTHLVIGLAAGLVIAMLAFTGATLSYEPQIMAALERDARVVTPPSTDAPRLPIDDLVKNLRAQQPEGRVQSVTVSSNPTAAVTLSLGRDQTYYGNPYTGEIRQPSERSVQVHDFFHLMEFLHRWLALEGDQRPIGRAITGAANLVFLGLAISGLWLWWPRKWSWRAMRPSVWFSRGARGKARDWNWHNVIGLWTAPIIVVTTLTGAIMSYQWASNLLFRAVGSTPPPPRNAQSPTPAPQFDIVRPEGARPLGFDALFAAAASQAPADWSTLSIRTVALQRRGAPPAGAAAAGASPGANVSTNPSPAAAAPTGSAGSQASPDHPRGAGRGNGSNAEGSGRGGNRAAPQPVTVSIRAQSLSSPLQLTLNPFTAEKLVNPNAPAAAAPDLGRRLRSMVKPLHTGTLGGWPLQTVMFLSALGSLVLVYTGFALAFRRFFKRRRKIPASSVAVPAREPATAVMR